MECNAVFHRGVNKIMKGERMKVFNYVVFILLIMVAGVSHADDNNKRKMIAELMILSNVDKMMVQMWDQLTPMMQQVFTQAGGEKKDLPVFNKFTEKMAEIYKEEMRWELVKEDFTEIYVKVFSDDEIEAMIDFYKSEAGKSMIEKMPQVMQESMIITQRYMTEIMPKIQELAKEMTEELSLSKNKTLQVN